MTDEPRTPTPDCSSDGSTPQPDSPPQRPGARKWCLWALTLLLANEVTTAVRIERLNHALGGILPNRERRDDGTTAKWRSDPCVTEAIWIRMQVPRDASGQALSLTNADQIRMRQHIARARANNRLRTIVSTWGLLQYLLVPVTVALAWCVWILSSGRWTWRLLAIAGWVVSGLAGVLAFHRAYFTSLGW